MLYYRALIAGLDELPQADARVRAEIDADAAERGWPALHAELRTVDPDGAHAASRRTMRSASSARSRFGG